MVCRAVLWGADRSNAILKTVGYVLYHLHILCWQMACVCCVKDKLYMINLHSVIIHHWEIISVLFNCLCPTYIHVPHRSLCNAENLDIQCRLVV